MQFPAVFYQSCDDFPHDPTVHIGEAEISSGVSVGEILMIKAEHMAYGRMPVMDADLPVDHVVSVVIRCARNLKIVIRLDPCKISGISGR